MFDPTQFKKELVYAEKAPCAQVLESLQQLGGLDALQEKRQAHAGYVSFGALMGAALALFLAFTLSMDRSDSAGILAWAGVGLAAVGSVAYVVRSRYARLNLENRRYEMTTRVVKLLQADMSPDEPVALELDLRPEAHPAKYKDTWKNRTGWSVKYYLDPWLSLRGRLLDGTHVHLQVTERIELRSRWKRSARGKSKYKTRRVSDALVRLRLRVKPERYGHLDRLRPHAGKAVRLPPGTHLRELVLESGHIDMTVHVKAPRPTGPASALEVNGPHLVAMALLSLYQLLNLSRAIDKKAVHAPTG